MGATFWISVKCRQLCPAFCGTVTVDAQCYAESSHNTNTAIERPFGFYNPGVSLRHPTNGI